MAKYKTFEIGNVCGRGLTLAEARSDAEGQIRAMDEAKNEAPFFVSFRGWVAVGRAMSNDASVYWGYYLVEAPVECANSARILDNLRVCCLGYDSREECLTHAKMHLAQLTWNYTSQDREDISRELELSYDQSRAVLHDIKLSA